MTFHFITAVWGKKFTDLFVQVVMPNQLSPNNLPAFINEKVLYKIYTTPNDADIIKKSNVFCKLQQIIETRILTISVSETESPHAALSRCHRRAIREALQDKATLVFLTPDAIFSNGSFLNVLKIYNTGKRVIMVAGLRVIKESVVPELIKNFFDLKDGSINISSRELVKLSSNNLHPMTKSSFWDKGKMGSWPSHIYWDAYGSGILLRAFHLHPLMVNPSNKNTDFTTTVDGDYFYNACPDFNDIHIVTDSDEITVVEMSENERFGKIECKHRATSMRIAVWAKYSTNAHHRLFFDHAIKFHSNDLSPSWNKVEEQSGIIASRVLFLLKFEELLFTKKTLYLFVFNIISFIFGETVVKKIRKLKRTLLKKSLE